MNASSDTPVSACVIVCAAGQSRRHPGKLLRPVNGRPALLHTMDALAGHNLPLVGVIPAESAELASMLADWITAHPEERVTIATNPDAALGLAHTIRLGLATAPDTEWLGLCNGDRCFLASPTLDAILETLSTRRPGILLPVDAATPGIPGHPVFFNREFRAELDGLEGDEGARALFQRHPDAVWRLELEDRGLWLDMDRWLDSGGERSGSAHE